MDLQSTAKPYLSEPHPGFFSLQKRIPLLVGLLLLTIIASFTLINYWHSRKLAIETGRLRLTDISHQLNAMFGQSAQSLTESVARTANSPEIKKVLLFTTLAPDQVETELNKVQTDSLWWRTELVDRQMNLLGYSGKAHGLEKTDHAGILSGQPAGRWRGFIGKLYSFDSLVSYPVVAAVMQNDTLLGYMLRWRVQRVSANALAQFSKLLGDGVQLLIGNKDGSVWTDLVKVVSAPEPEELPSVAVATPIQNTDWQLHVSMPGKNVMAPVLRSVKWLFWIGLLLGAAGLLVAWLIIRTITTPIRTLMRKAGEVAGGNYAIRADISRNDELGQLGRSFNAMIQKISESYEELEQTIALRTEMLEKNYRQLQESEDKFRDLLESAPDATIIVDRNGIITLVNRQAEVVFGYQREELVSHPVEMLIPGDLRAKHQLHRKSYFDQPKVRSMGLGLELYAVRKDGSSFPVEISLSPIQTVSGMLVLASVRDITERKHIEESIRQVNKELESFTYSVSHDLRAPLRIIDGYADILVEDYGPELDDEARRIINTIKSNARRMGQLIDDLLNLSRLGRKDLAVLPTNMEQLVKELLEEMLPVQPGPRPETALGPILPAHCDQSLIRQVWINLLSNAIKYSGKHPQPVITISSWQEEAEIFYSIKDNGVGFDMKYADKLFGVFQRLHKPNEFEGTGIGLALVYRIVTKHNGRVWAESEPGKGSTFFFTLPVNSLLI